MRFISIYINVSKNLHIVNDICIIFVTFLICVFKNVFIFKQFYQNRQYVRCTCQFFRVVCDYHLVEIWSGTSRVCQNLTKKPIVFGYNWQCIKCLIRFRILYLYTENQPFVG